MTIELSNPRVYGTTISISQYFFDTHFKTSKIFEIFMNKNSMMRIKREHFKVFDYR